MVTAYSASGAGLQPRSQNEPNLPEMTDPVGGINLRWFFLPGVRRLRESILPRATQLSSAVDQTAGMGMVASSGSEDGSFVERQRREKRSLGRRICGSLGGGYHDDRRQVSGRCSIPFTRIGKRGGKRSCGRREHCACGSGGGERVGRAYVEVGRVLAELKIRGRLRPGAAGEDQDVTSPENTRSSLANRWPDRQERPRAGTESLRIAGPAENIRKSLWRW